MATLKINGDTSGYVELVSPAVAGSTSIALDKILVADSSGNVGIGTSSPNAKLDVVAPSSAEAINIRGRSADDIGQLKFYENDGTTSLARLDARTTHFEVGAYNELRFSAGGVGNPHIVIDTSGNVGIGTANPYSRLSVSSGSGGNNTGMQFERTDSGGAKYWIWPTATVNGEGAGKLLFQDATSGSAVNVMAFSGGKVGIGTETPGSKLTVVSGASRLNGGSVKIGKRNITGGLFLHSDVSTSAHHNWMITTQDTVNQGFEIIPSSAPGNIEFSVPAFVITGDNRNVGIGTSGPTAKLDIQQAAASTTIKLTESSDSGSNPAAFIGYRSRGTSLSSPTAIQANNNMTQFAMGAYDGSSYAVGAKTMATAQENWTASAHGTSMSMYTTSNGSTTPLARVNISNAGYVTMPQQPAFNANGTNNTGTGVAIYPTVRQNVGNHYNSSTGRFTAPISGMYLFGWSSIAAIGATGVYRFYFRVNGSSIGDIHLRIDNPTTTNYAQNSTHVLPWSLNSGDYVEIHVNEQAVSPRYGSAGDDYSRFWGHLIS